MEKSNIIDITDYLKEQQGPWFVLQDPYTNSVHVVHMNAIEGMMLGELDIIAQGRQEVVRALIHEWYQITTNTLCAKD